MIEHDISTYTEEDVKFISAFSNTIGAANQLDAVLEESRATVLSVYSGEGEDKRLTLLDKRYIEDLNKIGFCLYLILINNGLLTEASDILEMETPQSVDFDRLMQIDQEYLL